MTDPSIKDQIAAYWSQHPQTYAIEHGGTVFHQADGTERVVAKNSPEFFAAVDAVQRRWFRTLETTAGPFGRIFDYERYRGRQVLEVGCGQGGMAQLWAERGANVTAVDLNPDAIETTRTRFTLAQLPGRIELADANVLQFPNASFDYCYSWGVLHHSPDLDRSIAELMRVLKPGGGFGVMLYHRESLYYRYRVRYYEGFVHAERRNLPSELALASRYTDGDRMEGNPHTWPVTRAEMHRLFSRYSSDLSIRTEGLDLGGAGEDGVLTEIMPGVAKRFPAWLVKPLARRWGWLLWMSGAKSAFRSSPGTA